MNRYIVNAKQAIVPTGSIICLDDAQYASRKLLLKQVKKGRYEVLSSVEFKRGEVIGIIGTIRSKELAGQLVLIDEKVAADAGNKNSVPASALPA